MNLKILTDKRTIHSFLMKNPEIQFYCIGDLDDFFWPHTRWFALEDNEIKAMALLYSGAETPTLLLFHDGNPGFSIELLSQIQTSLPVRFYAHLSPGLIDQFSPEEILENHGPHLKMILRNYPGEIPDPAIRRLNVSDLPSILKLYSEAYPSNWFDKRMLETGKYFGYFFENDLIGISGIHVYSPEYRTAALGNIATHPDHRGKGIALKLTLKLCSDLLSTTDIIGLNVKADNYYAIRCYTKAGFEISGNYDECLIKHNQ